MEILSKVQNVGKKMSLEEKKLCLPLYTLQPQSHNFVILHDFFWQGDSTYKILTITQI